MCYDVTYLNALESKQSEIYFHYFKNKSTESSQINLWYQHCAFHTASCISVSFQFMNL